MDTNLIFLNGFWGGFDNNIDAVNIELFEKIFQQTKIKSFEVTTDINKANILLESVFGSSLTTFKQWKYTIHYSGEFHRRYASKYDIILDSENATTEPNQKNIVDLPLSACYIINKNLLERLTSRPHINEIKKNDFCCFISSNPNCHVRNRMFEMLNQYKKVDSYGKVANNMNENITHPWWSDEFLKLIGKYKFIICFENTKKGTYITEKIVNPYLAGIVPIYWGTHHVKNVFNTESMVFLEDESDDAYYNLANRIIQLDNNDEQYLELLNKPCINSSNLEYWNNHYTIDKVAANIDNIIDSIEQK